MTRAECMFPIIASSDNYPSTCLLTKLNLLQHLSTNIYSFFYATTKFPFCRLIVVEMLLRVRVRTFVFGYLLLVYSSFLCQ